MAAMMVLPVSFQCNRHLHLLAHYLGCVVNHLISLLVPKRYALTSHLFADGQKYSWDVLRLPIRQPKKAHSTSEGLVDICSTSHWRAIEDLVVRKYVQSSLRTIRYIQTWPHWALLCSGL